MVTPEKVVDTGDKSTEELNFNTACKVTFAGFLRSGEFCHSASDSPVATSHLQRTTPTPSYHPTTQNEARTTSTIMVLI
jgi:hypothetical protein